MNYFWLTLNIALMKTFLKFILFFMHIVYLQAQSEAFVITEYPFEKSSIRAIEAVSDEQAWFAGSNGWFGRIFKDSIYTGKVRFTEKPVHFRSIAYNGYTYYILSIENPAQIFKLVADGTRIKPSLVYMEDYEGNFFDSMAFLNSRDGIALGDPIDGCLSVLLTKDSGQHWYRIPCSKLPETVDGEACFAASNTNIATSGNHVWMVTGGKKARVFYSPNKGNAWKVYNTPIIHGKEMTGIYTVAFADPLNGIIMGGDWNDKSNNFANKAITKDGGKTWQLVADGQQPGYISCVQYVPKHKNKLVAVSTEGIYLSLDGGNSWRKLSDKGYYSIRFADEKTAWMSGDKKLAKIQFNW